MRGITEIYQMNGLDAKKVNEQGNFESSKSIEGKVYIPPAISMSEEKKSRGR